MSRKAVGIENLFTPMYDNFVLGSSHNLPNFKSMSNYVNKDLSMFRPAIVVAVDGEKYVLLYQSPNSIRIVELTGTTENGTAQTRPSAVTYVAGPSSSVAGPSSTVAGPSSSVAGPSFAVAGPSFAVAGPSSAVHSDGHTGSESSEGENDEEDDRMEPSTSVSRPRSRSELLIRVLERKNPADSSLSEDAEDDQDDDAMAVDEEMPATRQKRHIHVPHRFRPTASPEKPPKRGHRVEEADDEDDDGWEVEEDGSLRFTNANIKYSKLRGVVYPVFIKPSVRQYINVIRNGSFNAPKRILENFE